MFKKILSVVTLLLVAFIAYETFSSATVYEGETITMFEATLRSLEYMNPWFLVLLIPEQIMMYYSAGQMYFAFFRQRKSFHISRAKLTRISLEINFVNHALPSGGASGLGYLIWRLKHFDISAGQISFAHVLRYGICAVANAVQTVIAIIIVLLTANHEVIENGAWALILAAVIAAGVQVLMVTAWLIVRKQKNIDWLAATSTKFVNKIMRKISRGKKRKVLSEERVTHFFNDLRGDYLMIRRNAKMLWKPIAWGAVFSFLELATYWIVGGALGHWEILPQIMIAEGIASVVGTVVVTPGGMGGYEGCFIAALAATGVPLDIATIVVIVTRVFIFTGTIVSGYGFYQQALMSRDDKFDAKAKEQ